MEAPIRLLIASVYEIPGPRYPRSRWYPLAAMLALVYVAMLWWVPY